MPLLSLQTHKRVIHPKYGFEESIPLAPYIRYTNGNSPPIYLQNGCFLSEEQGALEPDKVPDWVHEQVAKTNPVVLNEVGYKVPVDRKNPR